MRTTDVADQLRRLGVAGGDVLEVHSAFSAMKAEIQGGPEALIAILREAVGPSGTLVMPSMSGDDDVVFDPAATSCAWLGVVADTFWRLPGVRRSDNPHAFAAVGPAADDILQPHPLDVPHGIDSPPGRVYRRGGKVLLLGVDHSGDTLVHVAENIAGVRYRIARYVTTLENGRPTRLGYGEVDHCCERFSLVDEWLEERGLQRRGFVAGAEARLANAADVVDVVREHLRDDETIFLHPPGVDAECDEARASLG
jgi:aminoglycoside 3-N-acetyltransferase